MFIVNWDILEFCSQWNRMMGLNCFRGLLCAGCNSREPLFTGEKKFYIPHTVRISTEVNEIFAWVRINTCNQSRWFSEKQARCWSACWLCSCIFCHLDLESYPVLTAFCYLHPLTVGHFTAATHYHLSYKECLCEKTELKFFSWFLRQILVDSKHVGIPSLNFLLLSVENLMKSTMYLQIYACQGSKLLNSEDVREIFFLQTPKLHQLEPSLKHFSCISMLNPDVSTVLSLQINFSALFQDY